MDYKAAIFDVDGTIIQGNSIELFIQYLLSEDLLNYQDLIKYHRALRTYTLTSKGFENVMIEAFELLSHIEKSKLPTFLRTFYNKNLHFRLNPIIVKELKKLKEGGTEIILASGSLKDLLILLAHSLDIPEENVLASKPGLNEEHQTLCTGKLKEEMIRSLLSKKSISIQHCICYSNNRSDIPLLIAAGKSYWLGSPEHYREHLNSHSNIELHPTVSFNKGLQLQEKLEASPELFKYYNKRKKLIEHSFSDIIPPKCDERSMSMITGIQHLPWDMEVMQKVFFDPLYDYINKRKLHVHILSYCLFLEAAGIEPGEYRPLLAIGELLDICHEMFEDISQWTTPGTSHFESRSHSDISIVGNISIALLSMISHNLIFERVRISEEKQLKMYEVFTSIGFKVLFGNGLKLDISKDIPSPEDYKQIASWTNADKFIVPAKLWMILSDQDDPVGQTLAQFAAEAAICLQLRKDLNDWEKLMRGEDINIDGNYIRVLAKEHGKVHPDLNHRDNLPGVIEKTNAVEHLKREIEKYRAKFSARLNSLPMPELFKKLIDEYSKVLPYA
ncbi:MAG: hypothetical protein HKN22_07165 [Bacteroidia bacterium]|nr:hypothetical protein [Bacteroidia bacterium]